MASETPWKEGDVACLKSDGGPPILLHLGAGPQRIGDLGILDLSFQLGRDAGGSISWLGVEYRLLRPSLSDLLTRLVRGAQIITPKDAAHLVYLAGVGPGDRVAEAGSGSGALTIVLAHAVGPSGRVTSFDRRPEALRLARANVEGSGFGERVTWRERDVARDGVEGTDLDAVLLDVPEPWTVLESARRALRPGGYVATYTPTYNQLERTVRAMRELRLDEVRALELLERALMVGEGGTRPAFDMLGHTGFLAVGRRIA